MSDDASDDEMYSVTSSKTIYKRTRSRASSINTRESEYTLPKTRTRAELPVQRWAVDYNNKNYVRSQCNKNRGQHRKIKGRPVDWHIEYDNSYFNRCKVNNHKGLHRRIPDVKRKYVPDKDDLADATGWEFDYGPEFNQVEQDVTYIPEGRVITRGCYRWYGVKRNDSDCDVKAKEHRENLLNEKLVKEMKYGQEFLQSDRPHMVEEKDQRDVIVRRHAKGGYRHYEVQRNAYDITPDELASATKDPEWKRKYHTGLRYLDLDMCKEDEDLDLTEDDKCSENEARSYLDLDDHHSGKQGKPFRRTVLNKVYELVKTGEPKKSSARHRTQLSLIPGEGKQTVYEGVPDRYRFKTKEAPSIRSIFKKKSERQKYRSSRAGSESEEYEKEDTSRSYRGEFIPEHEERLHKMASDKYGRHGRLSYEEEDRNSRSGRGRSEEYAYSAKSDVNNRNAPIRSSLVRRRSLSHVTESFEAWRDNDTASRREQGEHHYHPKEKSREETHRNSNYPTKDIFVDKRRNTVKDVYFDDDHLKGRRKSRSTEDHEHTNHYKQSSRRSTRYNEDDDFKDFDQDKDQAARNLPPHVKERMRNIREKMQKKIEHIDHKHKKQDDKQVFIRTESDDGIDSIKHKGHPNDWGHSHNSGYEKYVSKNGSEIWLKKEEQYSELHHKGH